VPHAGCVPRHSWQAALFARAAPPWPYTCSSAGRWRRAWTPPGGRAWQAVPRWVCQARRLKKRGPCVRVRAVCGAGACCDLPCCSTTRSVYLARRNAVARVGQTMAWVRRALWRVGRWCEMGVIRVVRGLERLHAWGKRTVVLRWAGYMGYGMRVGVGRYGTAVWCGGLGCVGGKTREK
jgi:hypothetical protein